MGDEWDALAERLRLLDLPADASALPCGLGVLHRRDLAGRTRVLDAPAQHRRRAAGRAVPWQRLVQAWSAFGGRWHTVDNPMAGAIFLIVGTPLIPQMTSLNADTAFFQRWGSRVSPMHGLRLLILTALDASLPSCHPCAGGSFPQWPSITAHRCWPT